MTTITPERGKGPSIGGPEELSAAAQLDRRGQKLLTRYSAEPPAFSRVWKEMPAFSLSEQRINQENHSRLDAMTKQLLFGSLTPVETLEWYRRMGASTELSDATDYLLFASDSMMQGVSEMKATNGEIAGRNVSVTEVRIGAANMLMEVARQKRGEMREILMERAAAILQPVKTVEAQHYALESLVDRIMNNPGVSEEQKQQALELQLHRRASLARDAAKDVRHPERGGQAIGQIVETSALMCLDAAARVRGGYARKATLREDQPVDGPASGRTARQAMDLVIELDGQTIGVQTKTRRKLEDSGETAKRSGVYEVPILAISARHAGEIITNWRDARFQAEVGNGYLEELLQQAAKRPESDLRSFTP